MSPLLLLRQWMDAAVHAGVQKADAMCLSTVSDDGFPSARMMLVSDIAHGGLVFFTDVRSRKAREFRMNSRAAAVLYWHPLGRQVRVEGLVQLLPEELADHDFSSKTLNQQLAISVCAQSEPGFGYRKLRRAYTDARESVNGPISRPDYWRGFVLEALRLEFLRTTAERLQKRVLFERRGGGGWNIQHLAP